MSDEGFREIQLNGKQLIFLFMAVTVVLVVTFLFGVLIGRGVREDAAATEIASGDVAPDPGAAPPADSAPPPAPAGSAASQPPAAPATEELSYAERLLRDTPAEENLKSSTASRAAAAPAPVVQEPVAEKAPAPPPRRGQRKERPRRHRRRPGTARPHLSYTHHGPPSQRQSRLLPPRRSRPIRRVQASPCRWLPIEIARMLIRWRSS